MPIKRPTFVVGDIYHIVVRGVEGRKIFQDDKDYFRAIHDLYEFNDDDPTIWQYRHENCSRDISSDEKEADIKKRKLLVNLLCFCLMPNHVHLLLQPLKDMGISKFMRKFGAGYAGYFNRKYERQGHLFQGRFRAIHIQNNDQLKTVFVYIHSNPAALVDAGWKEGKVVQPEKVTMYLEDYRWSSYLDYLGRQNFPSVTQRKFFEDIMTQREWQNYMNDWIQFKNTENIAGIALE